MGLLFFGFLFYISWVFYKERMMSFDPAYFAFQLLQFNEYFIAIGRWGSVFSEFLPLTVFRNDCSLETFLQVYSVAFIINYYVLFLIITLVLKNYRAGIVLMLSLCLGFRFIFYYATAELFLGIALSILLWAIIAPVNPYSSALKKWLATIISLPLIYTISFCHQLTAFTILFPLFFELIYNKRWRDISLWIPIIFTLVWFFIRIEYFTISEYEQAKMVTMNSFKKGIPHFFSLEAWKYFKQFFTHSLRTLYYTFIFCWMMTLIFKRWTLFIFQLLFPIGYLILIIIINVTGSNNLFYEDYYTPFGLFAGVTLLYLVYERFPKALLHVLIITLLFFNLKGIYNAHTIQTERVKYLDRLTTYGRHHTAKKYLLNYKNIPLKIVSVQGFLPFETLIYSSLPSPDSAVTFYWTEKMNAWDTLIHRENVFLGPDFCINWFKTNDINLDYFHLPPTDYVKVNTSQTDTAFHESFFNNKNLHLMAVDKEIHSTNYDFVIVPIKIINTSGKPIFSTPDGKHPVYLTYHIYDNNGKVLYWGNTHTTLEVDIIDEYTQGMLVYLPPKKGTYIIEADFYTYGIRYWNTTTRFKLVFD